MWNRFNLRQVTGMLTLFVLVAIGAVNSSGAQARLLILPTGPAPTAPVEGTQAVAGGCRASIQPASIPANAVSTATQAATMDMTAISATQAAGVTATSQAGTATVSPQVYTAGGCVLMGALAGTSEVPTPGPKDASGTIILSVDAKLGQVCFDLHVEGMTLPATVADIHKGDEGAVGPTVVTLTPPDKTGQAAGCVNNLDKTVLADMAVHAESYYVNVDNTDFPQGADRGNVGPATRITSAQAVPPVTDARVTGAASIDGDSSGGRLCFYVRVFTNFSPTGDLLWIHKGQAGEVGPDVAHLGNLGNDGIANSCTAVDPAVVADILANPNNYYFAIYSAPNTCRVSGQRDVGNWEMSNSVNLECKLVNDSQLRFSGRSE